MTGGWNVRMSLSSVVGAEHYVAGLASVIVVVVGTLKENIGPPRGTDRTRSFVTPPHPARSRPAMAVLRMRGAVIRVCLGMVEEFERHESVRTRTDHQPRVPPAEDAGVVVTGRRDWPARRDQVAPVRRSAREPSPQFDHVRVTTGGEWGLLDGNAHPNTDPPRVAVPHQDSVTLR